MGLRDILNWFMRFEQGVFALRDTAHICYTGSFRVLRVPLTVLRVLLTILRVPLTVLRVYTHGWQVCYRNPPWNFCRCDRTSLTICFGDVACNRTNRILSDVALFVSAFIFFAITSCSRDTVQNITPRLVQPQCYRMEYQMAFPDKVTKSRHRDDYITLCCTPAHLCRVNNQDI